MSGSQLKSGSRGETEFTLEDNASLIMEEKSGFIEMRPKCQFNDKERETRLL